MCFLFFPGTFLIALPYYHLKEKYIKAWPCRTDSKEYFLKNIDDILAGCINKEPAQLKALYERYYGFALKLAYRYLYVYETAVDVVDDSFLKAFANLHLFRLLPGEDNERVFLGWLKKILVNTAIDEFRKKQMIPETRGIPESVWDIADHAGNADNILLYKDVIISVKELPPEYRIVFNMYVIEGYKHFEIAEALNIPVATSKSRLSKARTLLQKKLKKTEEAIICSI